MIKIKLDNISNADLIFVKKFLKQKIIHLEIVVKKNICKKAISDLIISLVWFPKISESDKKSYITHSKIPQKMNPSNDQIQNPNQI